jgi:hypothetical protein
MSDGEIDRVLQLFTFKNSRPHQGLVDLIKKDMARPARAVGQISV